jgi:hypothetical protein
MSIGQSIMPAAPTPQMDGMYDPISTPVEGTATLRDRICDADYTAECY